MQRWPLKSVEAHLSPMLFPMRSPISFVRPLSLLLTLVALSLPLHAQEEGAPPATPLNIPIVPNNPALNNPAPNEAPNPDGPPAFVPPAPNADDKPALTPPNNREARRLAEEKRLRTHMMEFGITEPTKQDALIAYLVEDEMGKTRVKDASRRLLGAVKIGTPPERMRNLIAVYKAALDADKLRRTAAQTALDARIGFTLDPHLEAVLWLFGVLGEGQVPAIGFLNRGRNPGAVRADGNQVTPLRAGNTNRNFGDAPNPGVPDLNAPNQADGIKGDPNLQPQRPTKTPQGGVVFGTVTAKGEGWIEVKAVGGAAETYMPFWTEAKDGGVGFDRAVLEAIVFAKIGDLARLEWVWSERKRVVKLEPWRPAVTDPAPAP
jgi:hypothetical protein